MEEVSLNNAEELIIPEEIEESFSAMGVLEGSEATVMEPTVGEREQSSEQDSETEEQTNKEGIPTDEKCAAEEGIDFDDSEENNSEQALVNDVTPKVIAGIQTAIVEQRELTDRIFSEVKEVHKLYHKEYAGRLSRMQKELDAYHEIDRGQHLNEVLLDVARVYCDNEQILDGINDVKIKKQVGYIFDDIKQLLESYDVQIQRSHLGDKRNVKLCKIKRTIPTEDQELNDTVANSLKPGFYKGNHVMIKEDIEVFVYEPKIMNESEKIDDTEIVMASEE